MPVPSALDLTLNPSLIIQNSKTCELSEYLYFLAVFSKTQFQKKNDPIKHLTQILPSDQLTQNQRKYIILKIVV